MAGITQVKVLLIIMILLLGCASSNTEEIDSKAGRHIVSQSSDPVWLENVSSSVNWEIHIFILEVSYEFDFPDSERLVNASLYLSLDNESFSFGKNNDYDPSTAAAQGVGRLR